MKSEREVESYCPKKPFYNQRITNSFCSKTNFGPKL